MRIAVLASPESWYTNDLRRAAADRFDIVSLPFTRIGSSLIEGQTKVTSSPIALDTFDAVLVRTMPAGSLEQVVFRMDALGSLQANGCTVLNPPRAIEVAVDKYLASARLATAGIPVPKTIVCQSVDDAMKAFDQLGRDVVVKPLFGSEGRGLSRLQDEALALRAFKMLTQLDAVLYLQQFIDHNGYDIRIFVAGRRAFAMQRQNPLDWRTNISRGARAVAIPLSDELVELGFRAADAVGASLAGVDLLPDKNGHLHVLEVNAVPGWKTLAKTVKTDIASVVLDHTRDLIERGE